MLVCAHRWRRTWTERVRTWLALALMFPLAVGAPTTRAEDDTGDRDRGGEMRVVLPPFPRPENYLPLYVSETTPFAFFIDAKSISVGPDRAVRYSVIAKSNDGGLNVSFEGMRCNERQYRIYAIGRSDQSWSEVRDSSWAAIRSDARNAQRIVLHGDFFCPVTGAIATAEEGVKVLKDGGNPRAAISSY
ncbi:MAG: hypothetical protein D4R74_06970 [Betaproteobacteria bacterium]|nr:MAG: hypothetical protein D4R74_06970 [Betaproteobacteria bacterium]